MESGFYEQNKASPKAIPYIDKGRWSCTKSSQYTNFDLSIVEPETAEQNCLTEAESNNIINAQVSLQSKVFVI